MIMMTLQIINSFQIKCCLKQLDYAFIELLNYDVKHYCLVLTHLISHNLYMDF